MKKKFLHLLSIITRLEVSAGNALSSAHFCQKIILPQEKLMSTTIYIYIYILYFQIKYIVPLPVDSKANVQVHTNTYVFVLIECY